MQSEVLHWSFVRNINATLNNDGRFLHNEPVIFTQLGRHFSLIHPGINQKQRFLDIALIILLSEVLPLIFVELSEHNLYISILTSSLDIWSRVVDMLAN